MKLHPAAFAFLVLPSMVACALDPEPQVGESETAQVEGTRPVERESRFPAAPEVPTGPLPDDLRRALETAFRGQPLDTPWSREQSDALALIAASGDLRCAWLISDLLRLSTDPQLRFDLTLAAYRAMGLETELTNAWGNITDHLMAWDVAAPPGYLALKRSLFIQVVPELDRLVQPGEIDWRLVTWGGVGVDNRPFGATDDPCDCIPAADDPPVTTADAADWLGDDEVVFGVALGGQSRAYPRRIMEVREMVNDTLGGRHLGMPYCTLCASAQAYLTDAVPADVARPILRTTGLLTRSNKVMYDLTTASLFDTFLGVALTGPLAERGIVLPQATVVTTSWGAWKRDHPETTVLAEELALGRDFDFRNTRDANGPIFPIGRRDDRLGAQTDVLGVVDPDGVPIAFPVGAAGGAIEQGRAVAVGQVHLRLDGDGLRAVDGQGHDLVSHQAFWFAWSQFHPDTQLWKSAAASDGE